MRHHNTVFHDVLKRVPWATFDRLVAKHGGDRRVRSLPTKSQFIALLYGQLSGAVSLREVEAGLGSHATRLYHLGGTPIRRSTLADANALRSSEIFAGLFASLVGRAQRGLRRKIGEAIYLIDSSGLRLSGLGSQWAHFSHKACGAKLHVIYDAEAERPVYAAVTAAKVNDITVAQTMPIEAGASYVFDLGYFDYAWWAGLDAAGCRIVTRLKKNTPLAITAELDPPSDSNILSDRIGLLPKRRSKGRANPFSDPVREIRVETESGKILRVMTNDLDAPAEEIAGLYRRRWAIELFFRWVKQTLRIRHFLGKSENAVRTQIAIALIAFLLLRLAQEAQEIVKSPLAFARLVRANLMHRKRIDQLIKPPNDPMSDLNQMVLKWA